MPRVHALSQSMAKTLYEAEFGGARREFDDLYLIPTNPCTMRSEQLQPQNGDRDRYCQSYTDCDDFNSNQNPDRIHHAAVPQPPKQLHETNTGYEKSQCSYARPFSSDPRNHSNSFGKDVHHSNDHPRGQSIEAVHAARGEEQLLTEDSLPPHPRAWGAGDVEPLRRAMSAARRVCPPPSKNSYSLAV